MKVYKDNVLCELKDANGTGDRALCITAPPMPVRGTANIAGMDVTWEGSTKSVSVGIIWFRMAHTLWRSARPMKRVGVYMNFTHQKAKALRWQEKSCSNGIKLWNESTALFNLNSKYSAIECVVGHERDSDREQSVSFIVEMERQ